MDLNSYASSSTPLMMCDSDDMTKYVKNLTSSYVNQSNESSVVATSVLMFVITAVFFIINLFSRVSDTSSVLNRTTRLVLSTTLSLFPNVTSYLFSEAKNTLTAESGPNVRGSSSDLSVRARLILTWMLLVELLRKSVEALLVNAGMQGWFSNIITHASTVAWLGYLVFFNLKGAGRIAVFGSFWVLCAAKLVQRVLFTEIGKHSFLYGRNARLVCSYMAQMFLPAAPACADEELLTTCKYVVMGEENLVSKAGPRGYELLDLGDGGENDPVVTVGRIWRLAKQEDPSLFKSNDPRLKRLCLSFALFKLMRRRFEHLPGFTQQETSNCRDLIFKGLCKKAPSPSSSEESSEEEDGVALFQMLHDEVNFVSEYYHSVHPVMLASPYFFVVRYFMVSVVVLGLCLMIVVLCGKGNIRFAFTSIVDDNYVLSTGLFKLTKCLWANVFKNPSVFFATIDISISYILFLAVIYEEVGEFIVFVFSNWFMVSLLCTYTSKPSYHQSPAFSWVIRCISRISRHLNDPNRIAFNQLSVLGAGWFPMTPPTKTLPKQAKSFIQERFRRAAYVVQDDGIDDAFTAPLSNGKNALMNSQFAGLSWFCESDSIAEIIFTWHIATSLLEMEDIPRTMQQHKGEGHKNKEVATRLSNYCSYLVAFHPELLPDDQEGTKRVYKDLKKDLKKELGCWGYYFSSCRTRCKKMKELKIPGKDDNNHGYDALTVVQRGAMLGKKLVEEAAKEGGNRAELVWELLAHLWVEIVVYVAPSSGEEQVKGHEDALVEKGGLITMLWMLAMHTGITRPPPPTYVPPVHGV